MPKEAFPRLRDKNFSYADAFTVPSYQVGRLDIICSEHYNEPRSYKVIAAANGIVDAFISRPGIRPSTEALKNELILRGRTADEAEREAASIDSDRRTLGLMDWKSYNNLSDGNITDVYEGRMLFIPSPDPAAKWITRYDTLLDEENSDGII